MVAVASHMDAPQSSGGWRADSHIEAVRDLWRDQGNMTALVVFDGPDAGLFGSYPSTWHPKVHVWGIWTQPRFTCMESGWPEGTESMTPSQRVSEEPC